MILERPVLLLTGARQTGKTSLCREIFKNFRYVSLDLPRLAEEAERSGEQFLTSHPAPLVIDEVQYAPALFRYIKHAVDQNRQKAGQYVLTGSQKFNLMSGVSESLAGRLTILDILTLSLTELEGWSGQRAEGDRLLEWMLKGGYPELHAKDLDPERFYSDYVATYLERDVRQILNVKNLRDFNRFMRLAALRTGQILSLNSFASDIGVSPNTIKHWLSVLEASQIIRLVEPFHRNAGKRLVKTPKLYFLDTGLACFLAGFKSTLDLKSSPLLGSFFETLVLGQFIRRQAGVGGELQIYFYRDHNAVEVDFLIPKGDKVKLYECKWGETPSPVKGFHVVSELLGASHILNKSIITPVRGKRKTEGGVLIEDAVDTESLDI